MGKFLGFRELRPGETIFGGKGVLIPYRPPKEKPAPEPKGDRLNELFPIKGITKWEK